jgi:hypothetical protein
MGQANPSSFKVFEYNDSLILFASFQEGIPTLKTYHKYRNRIEHFSHDESISKNPFILGYLFDSKERLWIQNKKPDNHNLHRNYLVSVVGDTRFELVTPCL